MDGWHMDGWYGHSSVLSKSLSAVNKTRYEDGWSFERVNNCKFSVKVEVLRQVHINTHSDFLAVVYSIIAGLA